MNTALEWTKALGGIIVSWPVAGLLIALMFRRAVLTLVQRFVAASEGKAEVGPIKLEMGRLAEEGKAAVRNLQRMNVLMAESRLLELEITEGTFGMVFTPEQRAKMNAHIEELRQLTGATGTHDTESA